MHIYKYIYVYIYIYARVYIYIYTHTFTYHISTKYSNYGLRAPNVIQSVVYPSLLLQANFVDERFFLVSKCSCFVVAAFEDSASITTPVRGSLSPIARIIFIKGPHACGELHISSHVCRNKSSTRFFAILLVWKYGCWDSRDAKLIGIQHPEGPSIITQIEGICLRP